MSVVPEETRGSREQQRTASAFFFFFACSASRTDLRKSSQMRTTFFCADVQFFERPFDWRDGADIVPLQQTAFRRSPAPVRRAFERKLYYVVVVV